jgi:hypothetical protein
VIESDATAVIYPNILAAAQGLLCETVEIVKRTGLEFVVIGGWSPYFLNNGDVRHPGSRDVDLLFREGARGGAITPALVALRENGFIISAKHEFQLLRVLRVGDQEFVFNVDLLHADEGRTMPTLFADHVSLPILLSEFSDKTFAQRSIRVPFSEFLFEGHIVNYEVPGLLPHGEERKFSIPLMDEIGTLVTKAESMKSAKRQRDAFDIVLAIKQARDPNDLLQGIRGLLPQHQAAFDELWKLWGLCRSRKLRRNICRYWPEAKKASVWAPVGGQITDLLTQAGVSVLKPKAGRN